MREAGILLPISSVPSDYGIGGFSKEARKLADLFERSGLAYWQILPLGPTGYGDSPYQSFSTFAGNPYFIDLETLISDGLLTREDIVAVCGSDCPFAYPAISQKQAWEAPWDGLSVPVIPSESVLKEALLEGSDKKKKGFLRRRDNEPASTAGASSASSADPGSKLSDGSDPSAESEAEEAEKKPEPVWVHIPREAIENCKKGYDPNNYAEYGFLYETRMEILRKAHRHFRSLTVGELLGKEDLPSGLTPNMTIRETPLYKNFLRDNEGWLEDYALYRTIKKHFDGKSWSEWDAPYKKREKTALKDFREQHATELDFTIFVQFMFAIQWHSLKSYINSKNIKIIGDIPIYVSFDSSDAWSRPELFEFDKDLAPVEVAGCPPDAFCDDGQLWGNPIYDWDEHRKSSFRWWKERTKKSLELYDVIRLDHFRGFDEYYAIPAKDENAKNGTWKKGPGMKLFEALRHEFGELPIIAEDLGVITDSVRELLKESGFPGMKVLQFAYNADANSCYLPQFFTDTNCVVYTGTHDNDTTRGFIHNLNEWDRKMVEDYFGSWNDSEENKTWDFIRAAFSSIAKLAIIPAQDFLLVGSEGRINTPSTLGNNFKWRMVKDQYSEGLADYVKRLLFIFGRQRN
ncbi:MAG: 4-alpha-glucanotransferase [Lachnospiraceae bacterium]|nr:4-alpha-glucanotransferase [Lachnospiraceae bacterium]